MTEISEVPPHQADQGSRYGLWHEPTESAVPAAQGLVGHALQAFGVHQDHDVYDVADGAVCHLVDYSVQSMRNLGRSEDPAVSTRQSDDIFLKVRLARKGERLQVVIAVRDSCTDEPELTGEHNAEFYWVPLASGRQISVTVEV
ncbi:hypothetical protein [Spirillospora sp. CA-128828]|uniref:hypothetical protein n=1 Tax=Spirillospora sp. CA-128828 TaxID=3240033 RepID=UPI003D8D53BC